MSSRRKRMKIYASRRHLLVTLIFLVAPFIFLLGFSRLAHIATATLFLDLFVSLARLLIAYSISVILGWLLAVAFYRGPRAAVALPVFDVLQSFPTFAVLPLATMFWGPSNSLVIFFLVMTIVWPLIFPIISSLKLIKRDWEETVAISGISGLNYLRYFIWPVSVPGLVTGSIIGLGNAWQAIVATEIIIGSRIGLGSFFQSFSANPTVTAFGIFGLLLIVFSINKLLWLPLIEQSHNLMEE